MRQYPTRKSYQYHGKSCMSGKCWNHQEFYDSFHIAGTPERHKRYFRNFPRKDSRLEQGESCTLSKTWTRKWQSWNQCGDAALAAVASILSSSVRNLDRVVRYGGDEFLITFKGISHEVLRTRLEQMRAKAEKIKLQDYIFWHPFQICKIKICNRSLAGCDFFRYYNIFLFKNIIFKPFSRFWLFWHGFCNKLGKTRKQP